MAITTVVATTAALNASLAAVQAAKARKDACSALVRGYEHDKATVTEAQEYASCVRTLYPVEQSPSDVFAVKAAIVLAIIGFIWAAVWGWKDERHVGMAALIGLLGGVIGLGVALIAYMAWHAAIYLFKA